MIKQASKRLRTAHFLPFCINKVKLFFCALQPSELFRTLHADIETRHSEYPQRCYDRYKYYGTSCLILSYMTGIVNLQPTDSTCDRQNQQEDAKMPLSIIFTDANDSLAYHRYTS